MTLDKFISGFLGASPIEIIASIAGFICVLLIVKRNIWSWGFGLIQVSLFAWVFYQSKLYSDAALHVVYIGLQFYGWWNWYHHKSHLQQLIIEKATPTQVARWGLSTLTTAALLGFIMNSYTDASFAYADAFTTCASLMAQWLLTRRHLYNWVWWIVIDVVAIAIYWQKGLYPTTLLYVTFLIMSCIGLYSWHKQYRQQAN